MDPAARSYICASARVGTDWVRKRCIKVVNTSRAQRIMRQAQETDVQRL